MTSVLCDSRKLDQARHGKQYLEVMRGEEDKHTDDLGIRWNSVLICLPNEASEMAQSLHR